MNIYVASSWRNEHQPKVVEVLRSAGHEVYDFRKPVPGDDGFHWTKIIPQATPWDVDTYRAVLANPIAERGYQLDFSAMIRAEVCVFVLPAGRSASYELGWCMGSGRIGIVLWLGEHEPDLMFKDCRIVGSLVELLDVLNESKLYRFMVLRNKFSGAAFVKEYNFFVEQGGHVDEWGKEWRSVMAESIEAARKLA